MSKGKVLLVGVKFFQKVGRTVGVVALGAILALSAVSANAAPPNRKLAANPATVLQQIDAANLPDVSDEVAERMRGGGFMDVLWVAYGKSAPVRYLWTAYQAYNLAGWELGRMLAVNQGLPDPGPKPNLFLLQRVVYWITR